MAGRGAPPKANAVRRNRHETAELTGTGSSIVPELDHPERFLPEVQEWWETWRHSPQSEQFLPTDVQRLKTLTLLVQRIYEMEGADLRAYAELRQQESLLGGTVLDRQRLRMRMKSGSDSAGDDVLDELIG
ncbi:phage terminase small subunit [Streptomyces sp. H39-S7]|uniref:phage terminase small subunit n=1 Tax=unclassified Streptomyces TaxID=2593676 RepID=UPI003FA792F2